MHAARLRLPSVAPIFVAMLVAACSAAPPSLPAPLPSDPARESAAASDMNERLLALDAVQAMADRITAADRLYRYNLETSIAAVNLRLSYTEQTDVSGVNLSSEIRYDLKQSSGTRLGKGTVKVVLIGSKVWTKVDRKAWKKEPPDDLLATNVTEIFKFITDRRKLDYVGADIVNAESVYHLKNHEPIAYQTHDLSDAHTTGSITSLDIYVTPDGVPIRVDFENSFPLTGLRVTGQNVVRFSRFGTPVKIAPPV